MTASYWVIREGKVRGQGHYLHGTCWSAGRAGAIRFYGRFAPLSIPGVHAAWRAVRVTRKPKPAELTQENAERVYRDGYLAGLDAAERICRVVTGKHRLMHGDQTMLACADTIAALKVRP